MNMKSIQRFGALAAFPLAIFVAGCYTVLMSPSGTVASDGRSGDQEYAHNNSSEISYSDNCLSCHSQAELDDRYYDMQKVGMVTAHGMNIDRYGWQSPSSVVPWWYGDIAPVPPTAVSSSTPAPASDGGVRKRPVGATRGGDDGASAGSGTEASAPVPAATTTTSSAPPPPTAVGRDRSATGTDPASTDRTRTSGTTPTSTPGPPPARKPD